MYSASYVHMVDRVDVKKQYKDEDGRVKLEPRNFYTTPAKKGKVGKHTTFTPQPAFMADDYDNAKVIARKEMLAGKSLEQDKPFSQVAKRKAHFASNKEVYDIATDIKERPPKKEAPPPME